MRTAPKRPPPRPMLDPQTGRAPTLSRDPFDVSWRERVAVLGGVGAVLLVSYVLGMALAPGATLELTGLIPASFFAAGKFLPLWGISGKSSFGPYQLGVVIWMMDTCTVLGVVYAIEGAHKVKVVKRALERAQANARPVLAAYPRLRKAAVAGIILFVLFPVAGTGAIGAAFIGVLLGMHRAALIAAVSAGGLLGGALMAFIAVHFANALRALEEAQRDPTLKYVFIGAVFVAFVVGMLFLSRAYRRALEAAREELER